MNPIDNLITHALITLPDSIAARKTLLRSIVHIIKSEHPDYKSVLALLASLNLHEVQQAKLDLKLVTRKPGQADGNGGKRKKGNGQ